MKEIAVAELFLDTHLRHRESEESTCNQKWLQVVLGHQVPPGGRGATLLILSVGKWRAGLNLLLGLL